MEKLKDQDFQKISIIPPFPPPQKGIGNSRSGGSRGGEPIGLKKFKGKYYWNFQRGREVFKKIPSVGRGEGSRY